MAIHIIQFRVILIFVVSTQNCMCLVTRIKTIVPDAVITFSVDSITGTRAENLGNLEIMWRNFQLSEVNK
jgi:hypothetical protein